METMLVSEMPNPNTQRDNALDVGIASLETALCVLMDANLPLATAYVDFVLHMCRDERERRRADCDESTTMP